MSEKSADEKEKKKLGRPLGSKNKCTKDQINEAQEFLLNNFNILGKLARVAEGYLPVVDDKGNKTERIARPNDQVKALMALCDRVYPVIKSVDVSGEVDNNHSGEIKVTVQKLTK